MNEWNIQSRAHACETCGKKFADKEAYHTLLFDDKRELKRNDICEACWQSQYGDGAREKKGFISYWHGVYHAPVKQAETIQKDSAESLLRKLIELNDPKYIPAGYILAVMLERKRLLKVKEQFMRDGLRVFVYEQPKTGDIFTIVDPNLQLTQLQEVQQDVAQLLEHGLNPPPTEQPAETIATATVGETPVNSPAETSSEIQKVEESPVT
ncbi:hypothetical protein [Pedosphaera parvula]|uniref:Uncharacterized protein n=1 Tax=Pedosphaera parvula (strain Ellin514) TaxID=320771 RepID=B9XI62_PEDPL|nr:hypothetical protein [Pedosphaera parvula]EEF60555.1 hypothetical protein Cflav_PD3525 [Pedosphaera parvula Ellin514]